MHCLTNTATSRLAQASISLNCAAVVSILTWPPPAA
jgi:hypothetical protein